jgi:DNA-directed RNA polymerase beta' subunit
VLNEERRNLPVREGNFRTFSRPAKSGYMNRKLTVIAGVTLILAAKGDGHGIDCADYYHYFTRGGLPYLAT